MLRWPRMFRRIKEISSDREQLLKEGELFRLLRQEPLLQMLTLLEEYQEFGIDIGEVPNPFYQGNSKIVSLRVYEGDDAVAPVFIERELYSEKLGEGIGVLECIQALNEDSSTRSRRLLVQASDIYVEEGHRFVDLWGILEMDYSDFLKRHSDKVGDLLEIFRSGAKEIDRKLGLKNL